MKTIEIDNKKTGWVSLPGDTHKVVAHLNDGAEETYELFEFLTLKKKNKGQNCLD